MDWVLAISVVGIIATAIGTAYKTGRWTGNVNDSIKTLTESVNKVDTDLCNHIAHYDECLSGIKVDIAEIKERLDAKKR